MPETAKIYYDDPLAIEGDARVLEIRVSGSVAEVILDRTIFYPEGGGQPCDLGKLGGMPVLDVIEEEPWIIHKVEGRPSFTAGDRVNLEIDASRRRDHSQQHSGQHLLSAVLEREYGIHTIGFHLGTSHCTVDVSCANMEASIIGRVEEMAETFIAGDHSYVIHACPPEDSGTFPLRKKLPDGESRIRIVEIDGYDWVACCGTHVASTATLRILKILYTEKYKGNTRIYFVAGDRAIALVGRHYALLRESALALGTSAEETPARISALLLRGATLESERDALRRDRAGMEIELALGGSATASSGIPGGRLLRFSYQDRGAPAVFETAKAGAARGLAVVAVSVPDRTVCIMTPALASSRSNDSSEQVSHAKPVALGIVLKTLLQETGGRGGGGPNSFRAVFETAEAADAFASAAVTLLG